jgi:hemerythrin
LAKRLRESVRECDIICRLGGDEFLVICPQTPQPQASEVAKRILAAMEPYYTADGVECWDGAISIGIAEVGNTMTRFEDFLSAADKALYAAKRQGGARLACYGAWSKEGGLPSAEGAGNNA